LVTQKSIDGKNPLLIEADGSHGLPLKAPAEQEPPIPEFTDHVIVVAGVSAFGKPINDEHIYIGQRSLLVSAGSS